MSNFHVGQKVVCVEDTWPFHVPAPISNGKIYTVAEIMPFDIYLSVNGWHMHCPIRLAEAKNNLADIDGFNPDRFRPVVQRKTDIGVLTALLNCSDERVPA